MAESSPPLTIFPVIGSTAATTLKFVNNNRTLELCMNDGILSLLYKNVNNFALSLESKPDITVRNFIFYYAINSCA